MPVQGGETQWRLAALASRWIGEDEINVAPETGHSNGLYLLLINSAIDRQDSGPHVAEPS